jgi:hypothetical protein
LSSMVVSRVRSITNAEDGNLLGYTDLRHLPNDSPLGMPRGHQYSIGFTTSKCGHAKTSG